MLVPWKCLTITDINKVMRASYGPMIDYQNLAIESLDDWHDWNAAISDRSNPNTLPPGFTHDDAVFLNNGSIELNSSGGLTEYQNASISNMQKAGYPNTQLDLENAQDAARAKSLGLGHAINPFARPPGKNSGILDTMGGLVYADKACRFALHKAKLLGVKAILGGPSGTFKTLLRHSIRPTKVIGVETADGTRRNADLVIFACGGWTPTLVPQLDNLCETTAGSVSIFQLPPDSPLWQRLAPENFPTWA